jgi:hypothetical protein
MLSLLIEVSLLTEFDSKYFDLNHDSVMEEMRPKSIICRK